MNSIVETTNTTNNQNLQVLATANFNNMFGLSSATLNLTVDFSSSLDSFVRSTQNSMSTSGGLSDVSDFFSGNGNSGDTFETWKQTISKNPAATK